MTADEDGLAVARPVVVDVAVRQTRVERNPGVEGEAEIGLFALLPNIVGAEGLRARTVAPPAR